MKINYELKETQAKQWKATAVLASSFESMTLAHGYGDSPASAVERAENEWRRVLEMILWNRTAANETP